MKRLMLVAALGAAATGSAQPYTATTIVGELACEPGEDGTQTCTCVGARRDPCPPCPDCVKLLKLTSAQGTAQISIDSSQGSCFVIDMPDVSCEVVGEEPKPPPPPAPDPTRTPGPPPPPPPSGALVGYGAAVQPGTKKCVVSQPTESALRNCMKRGRHVTFARDVDITLSREIVLDGKLNLYLDGRGHSVTLRASGFHHVLLFKREATDFMVDNIRFVGTWRPGAPRCNGCGLVELDGDPKNNQPIKRFYFRNSTFTGDPDGAPQPYAGNKDGTFERLLITHSFHPYGWGSSTQSAEGEGRARERLTSYMNVLAYNGERQPQLRAGVWDVDIVSSIIYAWQNYTDLIGRGPGGTGLMLRDGNIHRVNIIGNAFIPDPSGWHANWGCVMGSTPAANNGGPPKDSYYAQNTGNQGECGVRASEFSRSSPVDRPYLLPVVPLADTLDQVGAHPRTADEQALLDEIREKLP